MTHGGESHGEGGAGTHLLHHQPLQVLDHLRLVHLGDLAVSQLAVLPGPEGPDRFTIARHGQRVRAAARHRTHVGEVGHQRGQVAAAVVAVPEAAVVAFAPRVQLAVVRYRGAVAVTFENKV